MSTEQLEQRVAALEAGMADLRDRVAGPPGPPNGNWLGAVLGRFKDKPGYDEVVRLGREYRETGRVASDPDQPGDRP